MALFFILMGLEVKREVLDGNLSPPKQIALPGIAAVDADEMSVPANNYVLRTKRRLITSKHQSETQLSWSGMSIAH